MLSIEYAYMTHPGRYRKTNQDNLVCLKTILPRIHDGMEAPATGAPEPAEYSLFGVFDGLGGEDHGEAASHIAAETAASMEIRGEGGLRSFCDEANRNICRFTRENALRFSGTTASLLLFDGDGAVSCHIGDSRIYRCDYGIPEQLTMDDAVPGPGGKHRLIQCLGIPEDEMQIMPHMDYYPIRSRTVFMICTDGLTNMLSDNRIAAVLSGGDSLAQQTRKLVDAALEAGGRDNITLLLIQAELVKISGAGNRK